MFQVLSPPPSARREWRFFFNFFFIIFFYLIRHFFAGDVCWKYFFSFLLLSACGVCVSRVPPMGGLPLACYVFTKYEDTSPFATRAPSGPPLLE